MANEGYHEQIGDLSDDTRDMHRAIVSLMEEVERLASSLPSLAAILSKSFRQRIRG